MKLNVPAFEKIPFDKKYLSIGGVSCGFFGSLSWHQGALRIAFLRKCGLSKEGFIVTGVVIASLADTTRISSYIKYYSLSFFPTLPLLLFLHFLARKS